MQPLFGLQSSFSTHLARNSVFHSRFAANTGEYFRSQMIRSTKRSLIDSLSLSLFYDLRQRQSSESKRPGISVFLPSERARGRGSDGGGGGGGRGTEEHEFYKGGFPLELQPFPLPFQTYHFDRKVPFRLVSIKMLRIPFTHQRSFRSPWAPTFISKPLDVVTGKP